MAAHRSVRCLATGVFLPASSAHVQNLLEISARLADDGEHPVVHIQSSRSDILVHHSDGYTTAVARASNFNEEFQQQAAATAAAAAGAAGGADASDDQPAGASAPGADDQQPRAAE
jgi:hypothetical protein